MTGRWKGVLLVAAALALQGCIYAPFDLGLDRIGRLVEVPLTRGRTDAKVLLLRVDGEISEHAHGSGLLGPQPSMLSRLKDELDLARKDDDVSGILVRVNSPGGGVTASDLIYEELRRWRADTGRPVVAYFMDMATSGAYYIAQATDWIVASPTSITGSIGVIAQFPNVHGLGEKIGVHMDTIKSGAAKDVGNPFRPMEAGDRALLQDMVDKLYGRFVEVVEAGRRPAPGRSGMRPDQVRAAADGRVFTAEDARSLGLVDQVGYLADAVKICERLAGVEGASIVAYERTGIGTERATVYSQAHAANGAIGIRTGGGDAPAALRLEVGAPRVEASPRFMYIWSPGTP
jgi:protease-4